jgi:hypothetical protein
MVLRSLLRKLPPPRAVYASPGVRFEIYLARPLGPGKWASPILRAIATLTRSSYYRYGKRPLFDHYDDKAAIYLVRVRYGATKTHDHLEEWFSIRMVPGDGVPTGVGEPENFLLDGKPVHTWMQKKIGARGFWHRVASSSRMCGIHPYRVSASGHVSYLPDPKHRYTPVCFALAHSQFHLDYPLSRFPYRYITATIRPDFQYKGLDYVRAGRRFSIVFTPAYKFFGKAKRDVRANRWIYSYDFPLYWMDIAALRKFVNRLRKKAGKPPIEKLEAKLFIGLGNRIDKSISFAGVRMAPSVLRALIDREVPDAPELKITTARDWYAGIEKMLMAANITPGPSDKK